MPGTGLPPTGPRPGVAPEPQVLTPGLIPRIPAARPRPGSEPCLRPSPTHTVSRCSPPPGACAPRTNRKALWSVIPPLDTILRV